MTKKNKRKLAGANTKPAVKKLNLFELHINRKKYDVLGTKSKAEKGLPGVSRSKALRKRKGTLLQEYKMKDKKNIFCDKRIGERNSAMTAEDKILARYTAERMKVHSKKSLYNLGDDEELTHRGQTLTEIEKFEDPKSDNDDDEEEGRLDSNFVEDVHFGGGIFKKVDGMQKSRKDLIDQLISESIKRKAEKQKMRQQTFAMTEKLDSDWKELLPLVTVSKKTKSDPEPENKKDDRFANYDVLSKKLKFEARGKPSDRLKSEEEIAKEEKEKLEILEKERIERMFNTNFSKTTKHRSADDMDDGFLLENESQAVLAYKDGLLNNCGSYMDNIDKGSKNNDLTTKEGNNENSSNGNADDDDDDDGVNDSSDGDDDTDNDSNDDDYSDLKESDISDVEITENNEITVSDKKPDICDNLDATIKHQPIEQNPITNLNTFNVLEKAKKELPFTFKIPKEYEEFENLLKNYSPDYQAVIIERMIKCNHPSLKEQNKDDLDLLFTFLLQYIQDSASEESTECTCFNILDKLASWLYDLTQWNPQSCASGLIEVMKEKYKEYLKCTKSFPSVDTLIFFKVVSLLFPTSDYRHPVITPSFVFMQEILFQCKIQSSIDVASGLYVSTLLLEYCSFSKRIVPEVLSFLQCILRLAHPKDSGLPIKLPLQLQIFDSFNLNIKDKSRKVDHCKLSANDLIRINSTEEFKINALALAIKLLSEFCDLCEPGQYAIFLFEAFIPLLDFDQFGLSLKTLVEETLNKILKFKEEKLQMLVLMKKKPKPLRLYEPNIEEVYNFKKHRPMGKKKAEKAKLLHKYKREMKGALREIRRDRSFLCKLKYKETINSDLERKRKVQEILSSASEQQGELRRIQRKKK